MSRISLQMYTMRDFTKTKEDLKITVERLSKIGFKNLQYTVPANIDAKEVKEIFDEYGIKNDSILCGVPDIKNNLKEIVRQSELFETDALRVHSMPSYLDRSVVEMYAHYLNELGQLLAHNGIKILYHFHSFEFFNFENETAMNMFLRETDPRYIFIQPDTHWIQAGGYNPAEYLLKIKDRIHYVHVKDYAIGHRSEILESTPVRFAPVGKGNINFRAVIDVCESFNNKMYVIEQDDCYGADPFECVKYSFKTLKKLGIE